MNTIDFDYANQIIDDNVSLFNRKIWDICQVDNKMLHFEKSDFSIFRPANQSFFEYKFFEGILEGCIRDYLATPIFCQILEVKGIDVLLPPNYNQSFCYKLSNEHFADKHPYAFILSMDGMRVGIGYSFLCLKDSAAIKLLIKHRLDHFEIIDWKDTDSLEVKHKFCGASKQLQHKFRKITLKMFFKKYISEDIYTSFVKKVRDAVEIANREIGFHTIPNLSLRYLSDFKDSMISSIIEMPLNEIQYQPFDKDGKPKGLFYELLPESDYTIIQKRVIEDRLLNSLIGSEAFAKCFITSEYLYQVFQKGDEHCFDYSAVATGYFKSIELLLKKIIDLALDCEGHEELWIKCKKKPSKEQITEGIDYHKNPITHYVQVRLKKENEDNFSTEMVPLIWFIHDRKDGWNISEEGYSIVHKCLLDYCRNCRNEHLHKDVIDEINSLSFIRMNTILCIYYLLGGCKLTDNPQTDGFALGIEDHTFDKLYKTLIKIPKGIEYFFIQFKGQEEIKAIRLFDQERPEYNIQGNLISCIEFIIVDNFTREDDYYAFLSRIQNENKLYISRENMPERMWWYNVQSGKTEIKW